MLDLKLGLSRESRVARTGTWQAARIGSPKCPNHNTKSTRVEDLRSGRAIVRQLFCRLRTPTYTALKSRRSEGSRSAASNKHQVSQAAKLEPPMLAREHTHEQEKYVIEIQLWTSIKYETWCLLAWYWQSGYFGNHLNTYSKPQCQRKRG